MPSAELIGCSEQNTLNKTPKYWVLVVAAGIGKRMGGELPKQYLSIAGRSILQWTLDKFQQLDNFEQVLLILHPQDSHWIASKQNNVTVVCGGNERFNSVMNGLNSLKMLANEHDWILVHDAVRPCVTISDIQKLMNNLADDPVGGLLAMPVKDTLKKTAAGDNVILETLDRNQHWLAATPQMFRYGLLYEAMESAIKQNSAITDEASALQAMGHKVKLIECRADNIKLTHREDLPLVEFILKHAETNNAM